MHLLGMRHACADGKTLHHPIRVFDRSEAPKLRGSGSSWRSIAKALGAPVSAVVVYKVRLLLSMDEGMAEALFGGLLKRVQLWGEFSMEYDFQCDYGPFIPRC
jgi:hypothetical protein